MSFGSPGFSPVGFRRAPVSAPAAAVVPASLWADLSTVPPGAVSAFGLGPTPTGASAWDDARIPPGGLSPVGLGATPTGASVWDDETPTPAATSAW